jgi:predicted metal-dependent hydrolase
MGQRYLLKIVSHKGASKIVLRPGGVMELHIRSEATTEQRERVLQRWYRERLKEMVPPLLEKWQPILGVQAAGWSIRKMKTKWGTCSHDTGRIRFNLELAKKPPQCLEYIVVHELLHLIERKHSERFVGLLNEHLSSWKNAREELNSSILAHELWTC